MFQINANPNQNAIIMNSIYKYSMNQIQLLNSNEIYAFDVSTIIIFYKTWILATSNGLVFVIVCKVITHNHFLVFIPITKECIELLKLPKLPNSHFNLACGFFEHDVQFSTK